MKLVTWSVALAVVVSVPLLARADSVGGTATVQAPTANASYKFQDPVTIQSRHTFLFTGTAYEQVTLQWRIQNGFASTGGQQMGNSALYYIPLTHTNLPATGQWDGGGPQTISYSTSPPTASWIANAYTSVYMNAVSQFPTIIQPTGVPFGVHW